MKELPKILEVNIPEPQLIELRKLFRRSILKLSCIFIVWLSIVLGIATTLVAIIIWLRGGEIDTSTLILVVILMMVVVIGGFGNIINPFLLKLLGYRKVDVFSRFFSSQFILLAFDQLLHTLNKDIVRNCPFCGKRLYLSSYSPLIKYVFKLFSPVSFEIFCKNCGSILLNLKIRKGVIHFVTYVPDIKHINERDVWETISEEKVSRKLIAKIGQLKKHIDISEVVYYHTNQDYSAFFGWYELSLIPLYPFAISSGNQIAICKVRDINFHEIVISLEKLIFVKHGYQGEKFYISISSKGPEPLKELVGADGAYTKTSKKLRSLIRDDKALVDRIRMVSRKTSVRFTLAAGKVVAPFSEVKTYLIKVKEGKRDVIVMKRPIVVEIWYTLSIGTIPVRREFIDIARELLTKTNHFTL